MKLLIVFSITIFCFLLSCKNDGETSSSAFATLETTVEDICDSTDVAAEEAIYDSSTDYGPSGITEEKISNLAQLEKRMGKRPSFFIIKAGRDTVIRCKEGTLLAIPANAFLNAFDRKPVVGNVKISVKEFYNISDMVTKGLTTTSNGKLLETGGMISIKVFSSVTRDSCILGPGKNIMIAMVNRGAENTYGMQIFNGVHDSSNLNWAPRGGLAGMAPVWTFSDRNYSQPYFTLYSGFVFPDDVPKRKPELVNSDPNSLRAEIEVSLRDLLAARGLVTKKANAYIDTLGNLHCYRIGGTRQFITFDELYEPTTFAGLKVNLAADVNLTYKSDLNYEYYQKLFKMKKCNPDSLVVVTVTLNPALRLTSDERLRKVYKDVITVKDYKKRQRARDLRLMEYEKRVKALRLLDEKNLSSSTVDASTKLASAQSYFLMNTSQLGWINCDRFYNVQQKTDYLVKSSREASLLIVFKSIKSIMCATQDGVFHDVPLGEKITIVALKAGDGQLQMAMHETTVSERPFVNLTFTPVTVKEYKSRLEKLNRS